MTTIFNKDYKEIMFFFDRVKSRLTSNLNHNLNLVPINLVTFHYFWIFSNYIRFNVINARMPKVKQWMLLSKKHHNDYPLRVY